MQKVLLWLTFYMYLPPVLLVWLYRRRYCVDKFPQDAAFASEYEPRSLRAVPNLDQPFQYMGSTSTAFKASSTASRYLDMHEYTHYGLERYIAFSGSSRMACEDSWTAS